MTAIHFVKTLAYLGATYVGFATLIYLILRWEGKPARYFFSTVHLRQMAWYLFRRSSLGLYLLYSWSSGRLASVGLFSFHLMSGAPYLVRLPIVFLSLEFTAYWTHRLRHTRLLWPFHSTHHATEELTPAAADVLHPVDDLVQDLGLTVAILLLGPEPAVWYPVAMLRTFVLYLQHSSVDWTFGPLYNVFVSPVFHRVHHSSDPEHRDKNFGALSSFWDFVFGTAVKPAKAPIVYGVPQLKMDSFGSQLFQPFRSLHDLFFQKPDEAREIQAGGENVGPSADSVTLGS